MSSDPQPFLRSWIIGRSAECDLVVAEPTVSSRHCRLSWNGRQYFVEDLRAPNGVYVAGVRIAPGETVPVEPNLKVTLGWQIAMPWPKMVEENQRSATESAVEGYAANEASPNEASPNQSSSAESIAHEPLTQKIDAAGFVPQAPVAPDLEQDALAGRVITIGRDPESTKHFDLPIVSWHHARIVDEDGLPVLEDLGSRNGTFVGDMEHRIERVWLDAASDVYLGSYKVPARELLSGERISVGEAAFDRVEFERASMILGRDPKSDLFLNYPTISWQHARLTREGSGVLVEDLGSRNGTFIGGLRVSGKMLVKPGQEIALGSYRFQVLEGGQLAQREYHGNLTIEAAGVTVNAPNGRRLIEPVSMTIFPSELVAVMGPAGSGKTTLLKALNGYTRPAQGRVLFNGESLYDSYDRFRQQLGYVPQDDIVHPQLTVGEALYFSARLRTDLSDAEIRARTRSLLSQLGMLDKIDTRIGSPEQKTLSGGQRKRVNIALELINDTPVLFLDEPTSGLSSYDAEGVIRLLKRLARSGKTIVATIHQPSRAIYRQFDDLILINRAANEPTGAMVYFGPAYPDSIQFFHRPTEVKVPLQPAQPLQAVQPLPLEELAPEMLLTGLAQRSTPEWVAEYRASRYHQEFVEGRSGQQAAASVPASAAKARRAFEMTQLAALMRRNVILKARDHAQAAILLLQAPFFAALIVLVYAPLRAANGFAELTPKLAGVHFLMTVAAIWFGCNNAARDIVGEWTVYRRERMVTLKLGPYLFSKLTVLLGLALVQCLSLLAIVYLALGLKGNFAIDLGVLVLAAMVGAGMGISISAMVKTTESAIALLPVVLLPVLALGGGMRPLHLIDGRFRWLTDLVPSHWAYEANLLGETHRDGWRVQPGAPAFAYLPDLSDPDQRAAAPIADSEKMAACWQEADEPMESAGAAQIAGVDGKTQTILCSDVAEAVMPRYLIQWQDADGTSHAARAFQDETKTIGAQHFTAVVFRHSLWQSLEVLSGMFAGLTLLCLGILWRRDYDPQ